MEEWSPEFEVIRKPVKHTLQLLLSITERHKAEEVQGQTLLNAPSYLPPGSVQLSQHTHPNSILCIHPPKLHCPKTDARILW